MLQDGLDTKRGFFAAIASTMPLDPPLGGGLKWDALSDSLWEGVSKLPDPRIAIVWPDALTLADADPQTFETALGVLADVCRSLADREATLGAVKEVSVIVGS